MAGAAKRFVIENNIRILCPLALRDSLHVGFLESIRLADALLKEGAIEGIDYDWTTYQG